MSNTTHDGQSGDPIIDANLAAQVIGMVIGSAQIVAEGSMSGYPESVYQEALCASINLISDKLECSTEQIVPITIEGRICGHMRADIVIRARGWMTPICVVECKALPRVRSKQEFGFTVEQRNQLFAYMRNLECAAGVLVNFQQAMDDLEGGDYHTKVYAVSAGYMMFDGVFTGVKARQNQASPGCLGRTLRHHQTSRTHHAHPIPTRRQRPRHNLRRLRHRDAQPRVHRRQLARLRMPCGHPVRWAPRLRGCRAGGQSRIAAHVPQPAGTDVVH